MRPLAARPPVCLESKARILRAESDHGHDSHNIRHGFFKWLHQIELATNASSSEKFGSIHFATLFEIMATWRFLYKSTYLSTNYKSRSTAASNLGKYTIRILADIVRIVPVVRLSHNLVGAVRNFW